MKHTLNILAFILMSITIGYGQLSFDPESIDFGPVTVDNTAAITVNLSSPKGYPAVNFVTQS